MTDVKVKIQVPIPKGGGLATIVSSTVKKNVYVKPTAESLLNVDDKSKEDLLWNGSYLGEIYEEDIKVEQEIGNSKYWCVKIYDQEVICIARTISSAIPCIIDELKEIFDIPKLGTHYLKYKHNLYILIRPRWTITTESNETIQEEETLKMCRSKRLNTEEFRKKVREMYTFRDTLGITKTYDSSILVRWLKYTDEEGLIRYLPFPMSFYEPNINMSDEMILPQTVYDKWFDDYTPGFILKNMLKAYTESDVGNVVTRTRFDIAKTINRIEPKLIYLESYISNRISARLMNEVTMSPELLILTESSYEDDTEDSIDYFEDEDFKVSLSQMK